MSLIKFNDIQTTCGLPNRGKILQIVEGRRTSVLTINTSGYQILVSATITPASSSSRFLLISQTGGSSATTGFGSAFFRGGTRLTAAEGDASGSTTQSLMYQLYNYGTGSGAGIMSNPSYLDSPATTGSLTYSVQVKEVSGTSYLGACYFGYNASYENRCCNVLTVMEIAA